MSKYFILENVIPPRNKYTITNDEELFLDELLNNSKNLDIVYIFTRMSDGTICVNCEYGFVGKIKLQGRKKKILILLNVDDFKYIEGELPELIKYVNYWVNYINKFLLR